MSPRLLVLEDDDKMRLMLATILTREGYQVDVAAGGQQAIDLAAQEDYDLIIADIRMEGVDGLDALTAVKERQPEIRSLVVTGYSTEADSIRAIRLGVGDYLRKPFSFSELLDSVRRQLAARHQERARSEQHHRMQRALVRAVEAVARSLDLAGLPGRPPAGLLAVGELALKLSSGLGLPAAAQEEVRLVALVAALEAAGADSPLGEEDLPPALARALRHREERFDGLGGPDALAGTDIPLEARVAAVALASAWGQPLDSGAFDPEVVALLGAPLGGVPDSHRSARSLLSLARALEQRGSAEAERAYLEVADRRGASREQVEGWLGLARLALRSGLPEAAREHSLRAQQCASQVGPTLLGMASLEAGLLLADAALLQQAGRVFRDLHYPAKHGLASLALEALTEVRPPLEWQERALEVLERPENFEDVVLNAGWLLPCLLAREPSPAGERVLARLLHERPQEAAARLKHLSVLARQRAARLLIQANDPPAEPLQRLLREDSDPQVRELAARLPRQSSTELAPPVLRFYSMGPFEVWKGEERIANQSWRSQKGKLLLAFLAAERGRAVSEDVLINTFWDDDLEKGKRNLYWCCSILRSLLRPPGSEQLDYLPRRGQMIQLNPELPRWHDLELLEDHHRLARQNPGAATEHFLSVVTLYRGTYLEGCYQDWVEPIRQRVQRLVEEALGALAEGALRGQRPAEALEYAQRLVELDPCHQEAYLWILQAHMAAGRPEEAVRAFETCRRRLARELDMEPNLALLEAHQRALLSL